MVQFAIRRVAKGVAEDQRGVAALEYTLIMVVIGAVLISCINTLGGSLTSAYGTIGSKLVELAASGG